MKVTLKKLKKNFYSVFFTTFYSSIVHLTTMSDYVWILLFVQYIQALTSD